MSTTIGARLAKYREKNKNWTLHVWAEAAGISYSTLSRIENGKSDIEVGALIRIFDAFIPAESDRNYILYGNDSEKDIPFTSALFGTGIIMPCHLTAAKPKPTAKEVIDAVEKTLKQFKTKL